MEFALSGRTVDAAEALRMGLVSRVVDDPATVAADLAANEPDALAVLKRRLRDTRSVVEREREEREAFERLHAAHVDDIARERRT
jgi:enoyl-CoA hydratase/carnithine racemase